ncbi:uncharacterized protein LOC116297929 [Actinia tenebrosa]|uniref:Uncharacterized protein LOC116297929 n=1 Tax=Actinia tenebrosa TaxID=6105 RepID=A0A6P8I2S3_ACTTE|nr:uncharacterized protein LOC116297929 [Actinia tenebrosa]
MGKIFLIIIAILGSCTVNEALRCCTCANGNSIDVSYRECKNNNTCNWTCSVPRQCGPLFFDPTAKEGPPNVTSEVYVYHAFKNEGINLSCKIRSNPEANVTWLFNGKDIRSYPNKDHFTEKTSDCGSVLTSMMTLTSDGGRFACLAQNVMGYGNHTFKVDVIPSKVVRPRVTDLSIDTEEHKAYLGTTFNLSCTVNFNPAANSLPQIAFVRHGKKVWDIPGKYENFPKAVVIGALHTRKLSLKNVTIEEEGNWSCYGSENGIRGDFKTLHLKIDTCPAGYYCPWNESTKHECPYGTYSDSSTNVTYHCTKCPGEYPSSKPISYSGPVKSIQECPRVTASQKLLRNPTSNNGLVVGIIAAFFAVILIVVVIKFKKKCKQFLLKTISVNSLVADPELVINDFCVNSDSEQRLFNSAADIPEFPILYDVFISYSSKDVTFATEIQRELERQDFKCCIHIRDFTPGDTIINNISNAIYGSRVTLAILSPDFVDSEWCKGELQQALTRSMRDHRVIPILYKNCQIPTELRHRTYIDYENCYVKPYFWEQLKKALNLLKSTTEASV